MFTIFLIIRHIKVEFIENIPGDRNKSIPRFGVPEGTQVFAKQLNRHIFGPILSNISLAEK